jgi:ubiquinone/menaquinone biosynthesis C-methylase UbiE
MDVPRIPLKEEPLDGEDTVSRYDRYAGRYMQPEYRLTVNKIRGYGIKRGRVLDIGTGSGRLVIELAKAKNSGFDIVGLDISAEMLKRAKVNVPAASAAKVSLVQATAAQLPFADESFDIVTSYASLHHWLKPVDVFSEMWRVVKPGGLILVRDNRRMLGEPFYKACVWVMSRFMNKQQKQMWPKSILASYTFEEARSILTETKIGQSRVTADMGGFDLCIQARK